jgi:galactose oxidase-like protein
VVFAQKGTAITASFINSPESTPPGYYMLFAFNKAGTPSMAKIVSVPQVVN